MLPQNLRLSLLIVHLQQFLKKSTQLCHNSEGVIPDRSVIAWEEGEGTKEAGGRNYKLACRQLRVTDMFITLSVEMISLVYTYFKAYQIVQSNHV